MTAAHGVRNRPRVLAMTAGYEVFEARLFACDEDGDSAILRLEGADGPFPCVGLGTSLSLQVGRRYHLCGWAPEMFRGICFDGRVGFHHLQVSGPQKAAQRLPGSADGEADLYGLPSQLLGSVQVTVVVSLAAEHLPQKGQHLGSRRGQPVGRAGVAASMVASVAATAMLTLLLHVPALLLVGVGAAGTWAYQKAQQHTRQRPDRPDHDPHFHCYGR
ncbi:MAG: hypothetical protein HY319_00285 [Armatimonadetes bacterium]|nr:hypothetical protein [Armatimonadota bacterium]